MSPAELRYLILHLYPGGPVHLKLEADLLAGRLSKPWYRDQREHLLGWLGEYDSPGAYQRGGRNRSAMFAWNHLQCCPALAWLAEALRVPEDILMSACDAARTSGPSFAAQCGAFRRVIPWAMIEVRLRQLPTEAAWSRAPTRPLRWPRTAVPAATNDNVTRSPA